MPIRPLILGAGDLTIGLILLLSLPVRTSSPAYRQIKQVGSIHGWGLALLLIGAMLLTASLLHRQITPQLGQIPERIFAAFGAGWTVFWAVTLYQTAHVDERVSYTGAALWFFFGTVPHLLLAFGRDG